MGDVSKLPKWAQREIERLTNNVEYWQNKATAGPDNSDTFVRRYGAPNTPLGSGETILFIQEGESDARMARGIEVRRDQYGRVVVSTHGSGRLLVLPVASNVAVVDEATR